ncbi:DUF6000 family protein [Actinocrispum sp. NPDC049592]|uniref:DUF6000 family protein n=1 Tax=Actinocrispum sp. NPDC049592 TaxID=3154835 RepID=UPI003434FDD9
MPDDLPALHERYVLPDARPRRLLNGSMMSLKPDERGEFGRALAADARRVTDSELDLLLDDNNWRSQVVAAWLIGLTHRIGYRDRLGELLLASRLTFAGQAFCFALVRFGTRQDIGLLTEYLDRYLARPELKYDQVWALAALMYLDNWLGAQESARFLAEGGPWQRWAGDDPPMEPSIALTITTDAAVFAEECMHTQ